MNRLEMILNEHQKMQRAKALKEAEVLYAASLLFETHGLYEQMMYYNLFKWAGYTE
jgi:hypothetical protein